MGESYAAGWFRGLTMVVLCMPQKFLKHSMINPTEQQRNLWEQKRLEYYPDPVQAMTP